MICIAVIMLGGCSSEKTNEQSEQPSKTVPNLIGDWKQSNSEDEKNYQEATITDNTIEINWIGEEDGTKALYWYGTYTAPTSSNEPYTWTSTADKEKLNAAILASQDSTKEFSYSDEVISYEVSMMGVTKTVKLARSESTS